MAILVVGQCTRLLFLGCSCHGPILLYRGGAFPGREHLLHEFLPIILACAEWGTGWRRSMVVVVPSDNLGAVAVANLGYSKVPRICIYCAAFSLSGHTST